MQRKKLKHHEKEYDNFSLMCLSLALFIDDISKALSLSAVG